ncbi:MDR family MFS transporter [Sporobolomyces salmoneus]|uniref:MDR family MFS transporter n=1 Tax=Sporobolomyces salmoneus TaxID=183962 RepID=UPI0031765D42
MSRPSTSSTAESTDIESLPPFRSATSSPVEREDQGSTETPSSAATVVNVNLHDHNSKESLREKQTSHDLEENELNRTVSAILAVPTPPTTSSQPRDLRFYLVMASICCSIFLSALDLTSVSTALPSIAADFETQEYSWVASSYTLASTALIPWMGGFAYIFGRRPVMVGSILVFALGSALTGAAQNVPMLIAGRTIQGMGGGGIQTLTAIIVVDLVPIAERGPWFGLLGAVWAAASAGGPPIGGALASAGRGGWRWIFYLNLPLCAVAVILVLAFLRVKTPQTTWREKLRQMDWYNLLFVASATSAILGLTWGGVTYSWSSYNTLVPLILGLLGIVAFIYLERFSKHPTVPFEILTHYTSVAGYIICFLHSLLVLAVLYFFPVYLQSVVGDSAVQSGVHSLTLALTIAPTAMVVGFSIAKTGHYKLQTVLGLALVIVGMGLMTLLTGHSSKGAWIGYPIVVGLGAGALYSSTNFAVLAPLKPSQQPYASAFYGFIRAAGQVFGISIGSSILSNKLNSTLPPQLLAQLGGSGDVAFAAIPVIKTLPEPLRSQVREAFADSIRTIWYAMIGVAGVAFLFSLTLKSIPLTKERDENWGLEEPSKKEKKNPV